MSRTGLGCAATLWSVAALIALLAFLGWIGTVLAWAAIAVVVVGLTSMAYALGRLIDEDDVSDGRPPPPPSPE